MTHPLARNGCSETSDSHLLGRSSSQSSRCSSFTDDVALSTDEQIGNGPLNIRTLAQLEGEELPGSGVSSVSTPRGCLREEMVTAHGSRRPTASPGHSRQPYFGSAYPSSEVAARSYLQSSEPRSEQLEFMAPNHAAAQCSPSLDDDGENVMVATLPRYAARECMPDSLEHDSEPGLPLPVRRASSAPGSGHSQSTRASSAHLPVHLSQLRRGPSNCSLSRAGSGRSLTRGGSGHSLISRIQEVEEMVQLTGSHPEVDEADLR